MDREILGSIEKIEINKHFKIEHEGMCWDLVVQDIADGQGLTTQLSDEIDKNAKFYLDYPRVFMDPTQARIHMMPGADK